jgi:NADPH-dependent curcumin reductase CurA
MPPASVNRRIVLASRPQGFLIFDDYGPRLGEFQKLMGDWVRDGRIKYREDLVEGLENAPAAFIGLLTGGNFGKLVIRVA